MSPGGARYRVRWARCAADVDAAQALRAEAFGRPGGRDADAFDAQSEHLLIDDCGSGTPVACMRIADMPAEAIGTGYSAQFYDLSPLAGLGGRVLELGRFCLRPGMRDPDILRLAWGALAARVDAAGARLLFGCASFRGADPARHAPALALLSARHLGPPALRPGTRAAERIPLASMARAATDAVAGLRAMPPLLRSYLAMGGWVSDHAVIDRDMGTLHVFTGVEVAAIPPARIRSLRAAAAQAAPA